MQRIQRGDFPVRIQDSQTVASNQYALGMSNDILVSIGCPQAEGAETAAQSLPNSFNVHERTLRDRPTLVNGSGDAERIGYRRVKRLRTMPQGLGTGSAALYCRSGSLARRQWSLAAVWMSNRSPVSAGVATHMSSSASLLV
jgi:hypothetical protein